MGKASMCLKMLELLNTGQVYKCSELALLLETNSRNIIEYKKELEEAGYYITSIPGKYGGYQLEKTVLMPALKFTEKEKNALAVGSIYLEKRDEFPLKNDYQVAVSKIFSTISHKRLDDDLLVLNTMNLMGKKRLEDWYKKIINAIKNRYILNIHFLISKTNKMVNFHPYELFMIDDLWYLIGWDEEINDIRIIKFSHISDIEETSQKYTKWKYYNRSNYIDEFGIKNNDWYHLEFKISNHVLPKFNEYKHGKNLEIISQTPKTSLVKMDMADKDKIVEFVLSFNKNIEVIEPLWVRKEIKKIVNDLSKIYE